MTGPINRSAIIAKLQRDLLPLQGFKTITNSDLRLPGLGAINSAFPHACFPLGAVHEFICSGEQDNAATSGFIAGILGALIRQGAPAIWIGGSSLFPNALFSYGIPAERIIIMDQPKPKEMLWAMEEALKCEGLAAVVGEIPDLSFTVSRRLQLAVEQSRVTGFILRLKPRQVGITACIARLARRFRAWLLRSVETTAASASSKSLNGL